MPTPFMSSEESGQLVGSVADQRDAIALEPLEGGGQIENGLGSRTDYEHRRAPELGEVGGFVVRCLAMYTADSAGREYLHMCGARERERGGDRCRAVGSLGHAHRQIPRRDFPDARAREEALHPFGRDAEGGLSGDDRGERRYRAGASDGALHALGCLAIRGFRETLRQYGALERHDWRAGGEGVLDLGRELEHDCVQVWSCLPLDNVRKAFPPMP